MSRYLIALLYLSLLFAPARGQTAPQLTQSVVAGGGGVSTAGTQRLEGTIGQGVVASSSGGGYTLDTGFVVVTAPAYSIAGRVTLAAGGAPLAGVTVTLTKPDTTTAVTTTDAGGNYVFAGLVSGGYAVTPSKTNYSFTPSGQPVTLGTADQTNVNFTAASTATASPAAGSVLVSEFRLQGPVPSSPAAGNTNGELDEFVELYNNTNSGVDISGFKIDTSTGFTITIPANTVVPARGHYLLANGGGYSLSSYAAPDQTYSGFDLPTDAGLALLDTSNRVVDAVGFTASPAPYKEGTGLQAVTASAEYSFFRKECDYVQNVGCSASGNPKDTNENAADFLFADTAMTSIAGVTRRLGAPGPQRLGAPTSPIRRDDQGVLVLSLDGTKSQATVPNRDRDFVNAGPNAPNGTLYVRRRIQNTTASTVTRLRFRIIEMTTGPTPPVGTADFRARTSTPAVFSGILDPATCASTGTPATAPCQVTAQATVLEETVPGVQQPNGGGYNSTLSVAIPGGLAPNASVNVNFALGVVQGGSFRFYIIVEALP